MENIVDLVINESEHYEEIDAADSKSTGRASRPSGMKAPRLLTIRLSRDQYDMLEHAALFQGLPVSTFARNRLMSALGESQPDIASQVESAIRQILKPELLQT